MQTINFDSFNYQHIPLITEFNITCKDLNQFMLLMLSSPMICGSLYHGMA